MLVTGRVVCSDEAEQPPQLNIMLACQVEKGFVCFTARCLHGMIFFTGLLPKQKIV